MELTVGSPAFPRRRRDIGSREGSHSITRIMGCVEVFFIRIIQVHVYGNSEETGRRSQGY